MTLFTVAISVTVAMSVYTLATYSLTATFVYVALSVLTSLVFIWLTKGKSRFDPRRGTQGAIGWEWAVSDRGPPTTNHSAETIAIMRQAAAMADAADSKGTSRYV